MATPLTLSYDKDVGTSVSSRRRTVEVENPASTSSEGRIPLTMSLDNVNFRVRKFRWTEKLFCTGLTSESNAFAAKRGDSQPPGQPYAYLLKNINLIVRPGELVTIVGPSGCGKTTLLNAIAGLFQRGELTGGVLFNGHAEKAASLKGNVTLLGYRDQMLPNLTVRETLMFNALLKLPAVTNQERWRRINQVMEDLSLTAVANTRIGGSARKGLSSGELRRTSIAQELLADPLLLLLDEPTSGLDSVLAHEIMHVLRRVALEGRSILCAIHQPRSSTFHLAHKVVVMSEGEILYIGPPRRARAFFSSVLPQLPNDLNIADTIMDVASDMTPGHAEGDLDKLEKLEAQSEQGPATAANSVQRAYESSEDHQRMLTEIHAEKARERDNLVRRSRHAILQWLLEVAAVFYRSFLNSCRDPRTLLLSSLIQLLTGIVLGGIFFKLPRSYLPESRPVSIVSGSSQVSALLGSPWVQFLATGIDGKGKNPLVDLLVDGVDGNQSQPLSVLSESRAAKYLGNMMPCSHSRLELDTMAEYADVNFSKYHSIWPGSDAESPMLLGAPSVPQMVSNILMTLQVADYALYKHDWMNAWRICRNPRNSGLGIAACMQCYANIDAVLSTASDCVGLPPTPHGQSASICPAMFKQARDNASLVTFPQSFLKRREVVPAPKRKPEFGQRKKRERERARKLSPRVLAADDHVGVADKRSLQAAALVGAGQGSGKGLLSPKLEKLKQAIQDYFLAMKDCQHPGCQKLRETAQKPSDMLAYASVLGAVLNIAGCLFFDAANVGFASYDGLISMSSERPLFNKERNNHTYRATTYFIGKSLSDFLFQLPPHLALVISFYYMVGFEWGITEHRFGGFLGVSLVTMFASYGFTHAVAALCPSMETAVVAAPVILVVFLCCSGFFVRDSAIPVWMSWLKYISIFRWSFFALCLNQFPENESYWGLPNSFNLAIIGVNESKIQKCVGALLALGFGWRLIAWLALKYLHRTQGL